LINFQEATDSIIKDDGLLVYEVGGDAGIWLNVAEANE